MLPVRQAQGGSWALGYLCRRKASVPNAFTSPPSALGFLFVCLFISEEEQLLLTSSYY